MLNKAIIDLNILRNNARKIKQKLYSGVKFCAVVKADAYGHGSVMVASAIYQIVDSFAVALLEEGVALRQGAIDKDILCLIPFSESEVDRAVFYDLTASVTTKRQVYLLNQSAKKQNKKVKVHIKFNTGMNRQGVDGLEKLKNLIEYILSCENVILDGLYSHLACPENKKSLLLQVNKFLLANNLIKSYNKDITCHLSASGGLLAGVQMDMVRVGILLYGYSPIKNSNVKVLPVMKVYAPVVCRRNLKKGDEALYGLERAKKDTQCFLVRYGYADGLPRKKVGGQFNNRCMDLTLLKAKRISKYGFPIMNNAEKLAKKYHTICYEILTKSAMRAEKIYLN